MRERRSVNSHDARSIIASARRELRISCSIVSSSTRLSLALPGARRVRAAARRGASADTVPVASAARSSVDHAVLPDRERAPAAIGSSSRRLQRHRGLGDRARRAASRPGRSPAPPPACRRAAAPHKTASPAEPMPSGWRGWAWGLGGSDVPEKVAFDSTPPPRRSGSFGSCSLAGRLDEVFTLDAQPHRDRRGDEHRRVDAEQDADRQRDREVVQRLAAEDQHRQHHHLGRAVGDDGAADRAGDRVVDHLVRVHLADSAGRSRGSGRR